ncbi:MAG: hypothetical protein MHM6MM_007550 [Cercozoa sp. M6MM]
MGNTFSGHHEIEFRNCDRYIGEWKNGKQHGKGTYISSGGSRYDGQWEEGQRHGFGTLVLASTERKTKSELHVISRNMFPHDERHELFESQQREKELTRQQQSPDQDENADENADLSIDGTGEEKNEWHLVDADDNDGSRSSNDTASDEASDEANDASNTDTTPQQSDDDDSLQCQVSWRGSYEGFWKNNKKHGRGIYNYHNGDEYEGEWCDDLRHGVGEYRFVDGTVFSGQFYRGMMHGAGTLIHTNGDRVSGRWAHGRRAGRCIVVLGDSGRTFEEHYDDGELLLRTEV